MTGREKPTVRKTLTVATHFSFYCRTLPSGPGAPDPKDSYLLAMAQVSQAELLVTGDKELLSLKRHKSTKIITPAAVLELLGN